MIRLFPEDLDGWIMAGGRYVVLVRTQDPESVCKFSQATKANIYSCRGGVTQVRDFPLIQVVLIRVAVVLDLPAMKTLNRRNLGKLVWNGLSRPTIRSTVSRLPAFLNLLLRWHSHEKCHRHPTTSIFA